MIRNSTTTDWLIALLAVVVALSVWIHTRWRGEDVNTRQKERRPGGSTSSIKPYGAMSANTYREPCPEWLPVSFRYPEFDAWHGFDVYNTKPIPYRPFRWGTYPINMGIRTMSWDSWIELDNQYIPLLQIRKARVASRGDRVVRTLPGAERAALEVCTELASYLAKRYPQVFRVHRVSDDGGLGDGDSIVGHEGGRVKTVEILPTGDKWDLDVHDPMTVAGLLADDIAIMVEGDDGRYYMRAGSICVPGSWRLVDKIGLPLADIHLKGNVYKYKEVLQFSMDRYFRKMTVEKAVVRNNYSFQIGPDLAWLANHHGDEDQFDQATKIPRTDTDSNSDWESIKPITDVSQIYFRSERQTLRRMPKTGCICFTIRTYLHPVTELVHEPGVPGRLAAAIRGWDEAVARRKDKDIYADVLLPWLDDLHKKQIDASMIDAKDKSSRYPF